MDPFERVKRAVRDVMAHSGRPASPSTTGTSGESALENGDFSGAESAFFDAISDLKGPKSDQKRYGKVLFLLATAQFKQEKYADAKTHAEAARPILAETRQPAELAECLNLLGAIAWEEQDAAKAAELFHEAVESSERVKPTNPLTTSNLLRRESEALRKKGDWEAAKAAAGRALNLIQDRYGKDDVNTAECLLELGQGELEGGDAAAAIQTLRRALDIFQLDRGRDSDREIKTLQCLAEACQKAGDLEQSVGFYERALKERERQLGGKAEDVASLLTNLGALLSVLGRHGPAIDFLQQAVVRLEGAKDQRLGSALDLLGNVYFQFGRFEDALSCVRRAQGVWEAIPEPNPAAIDANHTLLMDIAGYLPHQRRVALGLATEPQAAETAPAGKRKKAPAPWDVPDAESKKDPEPKSAKPRPAAPARPARRTTAPTPPPPIQPEVELPGGGFAPVFEPAGIPVMGSPMTGSPVMAPPGMAPPGMGATLVGPAGMGFPGMGGPVMGAVPAGMYAPAQGFAGQVPPGYVAYPMEAPPSAGGYGAPLTLVLPDGTVMGPGGVVVLGGAQAPAAFSTPPLTAATPVMAPPPPVGLNGWDELGFEFLGGSGRAA